jgi:hypothetical protein
VVDREITTSTRRWGTSSKNRIQTPKKQQNKPESEPEAATDHCPKNKKQLISSNIAKVKMTTPIKVKTASTFRRQTKAQESPRTMTLKRLNTLKKTPLKPISSLLTRKPETSQRKFTNLLSKWEKISSSALTPAVKTMPRLRPNMEDQSQKVLPKTFENLEKTSVVLLNGKIDLDEVLQPLTNEKP